MFDFIKNLIGFGNYPLIEIESSEEVQSAPLLKNIDIEQLKKLGLQPQIYQSQNEDPLENKTIIRIQTTKPTGFFRRMKTVEQVVTVASKQFADIVRPVPVTLFDDFKIELADECTEKEDALPVYVTQRTSPGGAEEIEVHYVSKTQIAQRLGLSEGVVQRAAHYGSLEHLILQAALIPSKKLESLEKDTGLTRTEAKEVAIAVDSLRDESRVFGQKVKDGVAVPAMKVPRTIEVGEDHDIFVHLGERNISKLGQGAYGIVTKSVREVLGNEERKGRVLQFVAQKVPRADRSPQSFEKQLAEAKIGAELRNTPYVLSTYTFKELEKGSISVVSELCDGGEFLHYVEMNDQGVCPFRDEMSIAQQCRFFVQALKGVRGIHQAGMLHRDLKPENIFVKIVDGSPEPRIGDFGFTCDAHNIKSFGGTPLFMAPETVEATYNNRPEKGYSTATDAWAMGITGLLAFSGNVIEPAWFRAHTYPQMRQILAADALTLVNDLQQLNEFNRLPKGVRKGLLTLLALDPSERDLTKAIDLFESEIS